MPRKSAKHDIPGLPHNLGCPHCPGYLDQIHRLENQLAALGVCEEFLGEHEERAADENARLREENASLKVQVAKYADLARARLSERR